MLCSFNVSLLKSNSSNVIFSPSNKDSVIAEVFLRTLSNSTSHIIAVLKEKMKSQTGIFESENNFNSYENRGKQVLLGTSKDVCLCIIFLCGLIFSS